MTKGSDGREKPATAPKETFKADASLSFSVKISI